MLNNSYNLAQGEDGDWSLGLLGLLGLIAILVGLSSLGCSTVDPGDEPSPPARQPAPDEGSEDESSSGSDDESSSGSDDEEHGTGGGSSGGLPDEDEGTTTGNAWECAPEAGGVMAPCSGHCPGELEYAPSSVCTTTCAVDDDCALVVGDTSAVLACLGGYCLVPCEAHSGQAECEAGWCLPGSRCSPTTADEAGPWACAYPPHD